MTRTTRLTLVAVPAFAILLFGFSFLQRTRSAPVPVAAAAEPVIPSAAGGADAPTLLYAHNVRLKQGAKFRVSIRWIRGEMVRTHPGVSPSFDDPESFVLVIEKGVVRASLADVVRFLNSESVPNAPLKNISMTADGDVVTMKGTVRKIVPLPVSLVGRLSPTSDGRVRFSVGKIDVLKIPVKGLLGGFHVDLADMVRAGGTPGLQIVGNDVIFDPQRLLPPPRIRGQITSMKVVGQEIESVYGGARNDETKLSQWHNFLRLTGGTVAFGKLTMRDADLTMIDATEAEWFDLDLVHYQAQLVKGTTRVTRQDGLEIFMPGADAKASDAISLDWLKNRGEALPADIPVKR